MIWNNLYLCFLLTPIGSDLEKTIIYTINNGSEKQAKYILKKYCDE